MADVTSWPPRTASRSLRAGSGLGSGADWSAALGAALDGALEPLAGAVPDLVVVFASAEYAAEYASLLAAAAQRSRARHLVGCSASAVIAGTRELEDSAGIAVLALTLPAGSLLEVRHVVAAEIEHLDLGLTQRACTGIIVLADPFRTDVVRLVAQLEAEYPGVPVMGGLAPAWAASSRPTSSMD